MKLSFLAALALLAPMGSHAFFSDDNGCEEGNGAGGLSDLDGAEVVPFFESGVSFTVNSVVVDMSTSIILQLFGDYDFAIVPAQEDGVDSFVSALLRVSQGEADDAFTLVPREERNDDVDAVVVDACEAPVVGLTNVAAADATSVTGRFVSTSLNDLVVVDVTVVLTNTTDDGITYTYNQFVLNTTDATAAPVPSRAPVLFETLTPTATLPPSSSVAPTVEEACVICGSPDQAITLPNATAILNGVLTPCSLLARFAARLPLGDNCDATVVAVTENCGCEPVNGTDGSTEILPVDGDNVTAVPVDVNGTEVPVDPNATTVPEDVNGTEVPVDANATTVPMDPNATAVPVDPNATAMPMDPNATAMPEDVNATTTPVDVNGTETPRDTNETEAPGVMSDGNETSAPSKAPKAPTPAAAPVGTRDISGAVTATVAPLLVLALGWWTL